MVNKPKILVIDDDPVWCEELLALLSSAGYDVETASTFTRASRNLLDTMYAAIITDLELEGGFPPRELGGHGLLSGLQFLCELQRGQGRAIVLSAYGSMEDMRQAFKRDGYDFIQKQRFDGEEFLAVVREAVQLHESRSAAISQPELTDEQRREYNIRITIDIPGGLIDPWPSQTRNASGRANALRQFSIDSIPERKLLPRLRRVLDERLSGDELRTLCFDLSIDYDNLSGEGKVGKARELIILCKRQERIVELVEVCEQLRPDIPWVDVLDN